MIRRVVFWAAGLALIAVFSLSAYLRLVPLEASRWHLALDSSAAPGAGRCVETIQPQHNGARSACLLAGHPAEIITEINTIALATPRTTRLAGTPEEGRITWISRTKLMGYPDVITAQGTATATGTRLDVFSRQVYGSGDWGVNAARLKDWLSRL